MKQGRLAQGYYIRIQRVGDWFHREIVRCWGIDRASPIEWTQIGQDPTVMHADIFRNTEFGKPARKRRVLAEYKR